MNNEVQNARNLQMYGCDIDEFMKSAEDSITFKLSGPGMVAASLLSDCQEMVSHGADPDSINQLINRTKAFISKHLMHTGPVDTADADSPSTARDRRRRF